SQHCRLQAQEAALCAQFARGQTSGSLRLPSRGAAAAGRGRTGSAISRRRLATVAATGTNVAADAEVDLYGLLGVDRSADKAELKRAFRKLALQADRRRLVSHVAHRVRHTFFPVTQCTPLSPAPSQHLLPPRPSLPSWLRSSSSLPHAASLSPLCLLPALLPALLSASLSLQYHPDVNSDPGAADTFIQL
ncbi:unnamed protein product, partial [Closterium sp. NIES-54]